MPTIKDYPVSIAITLHRDPPGGHIFKITKEVYQYGVKISEDVTDYEIDPSPEPDQIVGLIQATYPDVYNTITSVAQLNDGVPITITQRGMYHMCANCTSLQSVDVKTDFDYSGWTGGYVYAFSRHQYAFYNCTSLVSVDFDDLFDYIAVENRWGECQSMFEGCSELTTITTSDNKIYINDLLDSKDMFKGCTKLTGLNIVCNTDLSQPYTPYGSTETYEHGYEYLGLTADQFTQVEA